MIRFSCSHCGKSLRAHETIVGRRSSCSQCGNLNRVPETSTREPGEKRRSQKDSRAAKKTVHFEGHAVDELHVRSPLMTGLNTHQTAPKAIQVPTNVNRQSDRSGRESQTFEPVFKFARPQPKLWPMVSVGIVGCFLMGAAIYLSAGILNRGPSFEVKAAFELTADYGNYERAVAELKRSKRILDVTGDGLLAAKNLPRSTLGSLAELEQRIESLMEEGAPATTEASVFFDSGNIKAARRLILEETEKVKDLTADIKKQTQQLQAETYSGK